MHSQEEKPERNGNTLVVHCSLSPGLLEDREDPGPGIPDRASGPGVHRLPWRAQVWQIGGAEAFAGTEGALEGGENSSFCVSGHTPLPSSPPPISAASTAVLGPAPTSKQSKSKQSLKESKQLRSKEPASHPFPAKVNRLRVC